MHPHLAFCPQPYAFLAINFCTNCGKTPQRDLRDSSRSFGSAALRKRLVKTQCCQGSVNFLREKKEPIAGVVSGLRADQSLYSGEGMLKFSAQKELLETRLATSGADGRQVVALTKALERLNAGEYGYCRICGADIPAQQLREQPENPFCPSCSA